MFCEDVVVSGEGRADGHGDEHLTCMKEADRRVAAGLCAMCSCAARGRVAQTVPRRVREGRQVQVVLAWLRATCATNSLVTAGSAARAARKFCARHAYCITSAA